RGGDDIAKPIEELLPRLSVFEQRIQLTPQLIVAATDVLEESVPCVRRQISCVLVHARRPIALVSFAGPF
ncbi:MAG: hypothetical protein ACRENH_17800, partial [Gemmatimonadaceae bacterium]